MLDPGTPAPEFTLPDQDGNAVSLAGQRGHWVLLWWYPKASTPGCTVEGQALRDKADEFRSADCVVIGISFDTPADNKVFADTQEFGFALLSDLDHEVGRSYDVRRSPDDQYAEFPLRTSYLIDPDGVIRKAYAVADVAGQPEGVLRDLAELSAGT